MLGSGFVAVSGFEVGFGRNSEKSKLVLAAADDVAPQLSINLGADAVDEGGFTEAGDDRKSNGVADPETVGAFTAAAATAGFAPPDCSAASRFFSSRVNGP